MKKVGRRPWFLLAVGLLAVPLAGAALSHACTGLATLGVSQSAAPPGTVVTVSGKGFTAHDPSDVRTGELAKIRLGTLSSPVLAEAAPSGSDGSFTVQVRVPPMAPGEYVLSATQRRSDGTPSYGTPARQGFTVTAAPGAAPQPGAPAPTVPSEEADNQEALAEAIARCKGRYNPRKAKTAAKKKVVKKRRAACVRRARNRLS